MTEPIVEIWSSIQCDPELVEGLTFGQLDELVAYVVGVPELFRGVPVGLMKRLIATSKGTDDVEGMIASFKELLNLPTVRRALDALGTSDDDQESGL